MQAHVLSLHTHNLRVQLKGKNAVMLQIKLKGKTYRPTLKQTILPYTQPWLLCQVER